MSDNEKQSETNKGVLIGGIAFPPYKCNIPDLEEYLNQTISIWLNSYALGTKKVPTESYFRISNFFRLLNQTTYQYECARQELLLHVDPQNKVLKHYYSALSHFESCISFLHRTIRFIKSIKRDKSTQTISRHQSVLTNKTEKDLKDFRDSIEHIDNMIANGEITQEMNKILSISENSIKLKDVEISFSELANWIKQLHDIGRELVK